MQRTSRLVRMRKWERVRTKGLWHFVLVRGVLGWGVPMFAFMAVLLPLVSHRPQAFEPRTLAINAVLWPSAGFLWGLLTYAAMARLFKNDRD